MLNVSTTKIFAVKTAIIKKPCGIPYTILLILIKKTNPPTKLKTKSSHVTSDPQANTDKLNHFFTDIGPNMGSSITPSSLYSENFFHFSNTKN